MENINSKTVDLFQTVVKGGYCIGCGACAAVQNSPIKIILDEFSKFQATYEKPISNSLNTKLKSVCPFSDESQNEDQIGSELFKGKTNYHPKLGYFHSTYAGYVLEDGFRENGSSGGMVSWILTTLLKRDLIDGVIHVLPRIPTSEDPRLFHYQLSKTIPNILLGAKSKYYPIELSEMIHLILNNSGRYAVVGIPCFIKAIRLLSRQDNILNERIKFCIGLVCGHLKSTRFAELFSWQLGINPTQLKAIDFRTKLKNFNANQYGVTIIGNVDGKEIIKVSPPTNKLYGTNWGYGFFKYKACDYCDDVVAETADITIGDAWLPKYINDSKGTNIIVVRNLIFKKILESAQNANLINIKKIQPEDIIKSQDSGFKHRREGLAYRLLLADQAENWRPKKRVPAGTIIKKKIRQRQKLRIELSEQSHIAFKEAIEKNSFTVFIDKMNPLLKKYQEYYRPPLWRRILGQIYRTILKK